MWHLARVALASLTLPQSSVGTYRPGDLRRVEGITMRWCPAGVFMMGSPITETGRRFDEGPVATRLTRGFWMGQIEVTQADWRRVVGPFPDRPPTPESGLGDDVPVYWVNYFEAEDFCARLTRQARSSGAISHGEQVRIPTEAQWEYACRAGASTATAFGDVVTKSTANIQGAGGRAVSVGRYSSNAWGLHDMHGNVFEWCRDWYHSTLPGGTNPDLSNQRGAPNRDGSYSRTRRGGAWNDPTVYCRSACRSRYEPERRSDHIGLRVVLEQSWQPSFPSVEPRRVINRSVL
jgi:formylglycine-generating enzyme required for sulfatase activity